MSPVAPLPPLVRHAVRAVLLDPGGRTLLFRVVEPAGKWTFWITPGGGREPGESEEEAVRREVLEETGIAGFALGPCVWERRHVFDWGGRTIDQRERYFLVRTGAVEVSTAGFTAVERSELAEHRWWTAEEIEGSREGFAPRRLGVLLRDLLEGRIPRDPLDVGV